MGREVPARGQVHSQKPKFTKRGALRLKTHGFQREDQTNYGRYLILGDVPLLQTHKQIHANLRLLAWGKACDHFKQGPTIVWGLIFFSHRWWSG